MANKKILTVKTEKLNFSALSKCEQDYFYRTLFDSLLKIKQSQQDKNN